MSKRMNIIGQKFGKLTVIERADDYISPSGHRASMFKCICDCGNEIVCLGNNLKKGNTTTCGCSRDVAPYNFEDLAGLKFGRLTVVEKYYYTQNNGRVRLKWKCVCECGNITYCDPYDLKSGHSQSCGCLCGEINSERCLEDLSGRKFGMLTVINRAEDYVQPNGEHCRMWNCICDCGNKTKVRASCLKYGVTKSCGCIKSIGEKEISDILNINNIEFEKEFSFEDCLSSKGNKLYFDFAIFKENALVCLIEYQGLQHYIVPKNSKWFGELQRTETDQIKRDYCMSHNIKLYEIRYDECTQDKMHEIIETIHANTVPSA